MKCSLDSGLSHFFLFIEKLFVIIKKSNFYFASPLFDSESIDYLRKEWAVGWPVVNNARRRTFATEMGHFVSPCSAPRRPFDSVETVSPPSTTLFEAGRGFQLLSLSPPHTLPHRSADIIDIASHTTTVCSSRSLLYRASFLLKTFAKHDQQYSTTPEAFSSKWLLENFA